MATFKGKLQSVHIVNNGDVCCLSIKSLAGPIPSKFVMLWSYPTSDSSAEARLRYSMWLSLARDAVINTKTVIAVYDSGTALVTGFVLYG